MSLITTEDALKWIANVFEVSPENITADTPRDEIEAWDSLGMLTLMSVLDEDFEILLSEDQVQNMRAVSDIIDVLRSSGKLVD